jgi:hypothetical protein
VVAAQIRDRTDADGLDTSWALVTMVTAAAARSALGAVMKTPDGKTQLEVTKYSREQAAASTGGMKRVLSEAESVFAKMASMAPNYLDGTKQAALHQALPVTQALSLDFVHGAGPGGMILGGTGEHVLHYQADTGLKPRGVRGGGRVDFAGFQCRSDAGFHFQLDWKEEDVQYYEHDRVGGKVDTQG